MAMMADTALVAQRAAGVESLQASSVCVVPLKSGAAMDPNPPPATASPRPYPLVTRSTNGPLTSAKGFAEGKPEGKSPYTLQLQPSYI